MRTFSESEPVQLEDIIELQNDQLKVDINKLKEILKAMEHITCELFKERDVDLTDRVIDDIKIECKYLINYIEQNLKAVNWYKNTIYYRNKELKEKQQKRTLKEIIKDTINNALEEINGNQVKAAYLLGISRGCLRANMSDKWLVGRGRRKRQ